MMTEDEKALLEPAMKHWKHIDPLLRYIDDGDHYDMQCQCIDRLIDMIGEGENHPLASLIDSLGISIGRYEKEYMPQVYDSGVHALRRLMVVNGIMDWRGLAQVIDPQAAQEFCNRSRSRITMAQARKLSKRFEVPILTFIDL